MSYEPEEIIKPNREDYSDDESYQDDLNVYDQKLLFRFGSPIQIIQENDPEISSAQRVIQFIEDAMNCFNAYQLNQCKDIAEFRMSFRCMMLALGFNLVADADGPSELAMKTGFSKQAVGKCLNQFLEQLKLTPLLSQRDEESRENMSKARKEQVR